MSWFTEMIGMKPTQEGGEVEERCPESPVEEWRPDLDVKGLLPEGCTDVQVKRIQIAPGTEYLVIHAGYSGAGIKLKVAVSREGKYYLNPKWNRALEGTPGYYERTLARGGVSRDETKRLIGADVQGQLDFAARWGWPKDKVVRFYVFEVGEHGTFYSLSSDLDANGELVARRQGGSDGHLYDVEGMQRFRFGGPGLSYAIVERHVGSTEELPDELKVGTGRWSHPIQEIADLLEMPGNEVLRR